MTDESVLHHIKELADEEHRLYQEGDLTPEKDERLARIKTELDQCWDLLRRRRAREEFGEDPDQETVRPADVVENYRQ